MRLTTNIVGARRRTWRVGPAGGGVVLAARGRVAAAVRAHRRRRVVDDGHRPDGAGRRLGRRCRRTGFEHRLGHHRRRPFGHRVGGSGRRPAVARRRRPPRRRRRRRADASTISTGCRPTPGPVGMGMSEGGVSAVEEAPRLQGRRGSTAAAPAPGPGGSVIAAMLRRGKPACAAMSSASGRCGSRPTARSALVPPGAAGHARRRRCAGVAAPVRRPCRRPTGSA